MTNTVNIKKFVFWLIWALLLLLIPFYAFTLLFEIDAVKAGQFKTLLSPLIGVLVLITHIVILIYAFKMFRRQELLSKTYLVLLGGSMINGFIWAGGCAMMGPFRLAGLFR